MNEYKHDIPSDKGGRPGKYTNMGLLILCVETGDRYESYAMASRDLGIDASSIRKCIDHHRKSAGGYHFKLVFRGSGH